MDSKRERTKKGYRKGANEEWALEFTVPGSKVVEMDKNAIIFDTEKIMSLVFASCTIWKRDGETNLHSPAPLSVTAHISKCLYIHH